MEDIGTALGILIGIVIIGVVGILLFSIFSYFIHTIIDDFKNDKILLKISIAFLIILFFVKICK